MGVFFCKISFNGTDLETISTHKLINLLNKNTRSNVVVMSNVIIVKYVKTSYNRIICFLMPILVVTVMFVE